jgi:hypothetical protein
MPLVTPHIDIGRISRIWYPGIIPFTIIQGVPVIIVTFWQLHTQIHVLAFCGSGHAIFHRRHDFRWVPLIAKHIDVGGLCGIRAPATHSLGPLYVTVLIPCRGIRPSACHKVPNIFAINGTGYTIFRATHMIPSPFHRKFVNVRRVSWIWTPIGIYAARIDPFGYVPISSIGSVMYLRCDMIIGLLTVPVTGNEIHTRIRLVLIGPSMPLVLLPGRWFPKKVPSLEIR